MSKKRGNVIAETLVGNAVPGVPAAEGGNCIRCAGAMHLRNAGLRPQARAASNRRRRLLASVDGVPYAYVYVIALWGEPSASPFLSLCPKTTAKNCQMRQLQRNRFHGIMLTYRRSMPTPQNRHNSLKQRRKFPSDSRCGSVETCRNSASVLLRCGENAREMVGAFRVVTQWQV